MIRRQVLMFLGMMPILSVQKPANGQPGNDMTVYYLGRVNCQRCDSAVEERGEIRRGVGLHPAEMWLIDAECTACCAKYVGWVHPGPEEKYGNGRAERKLVADHGFYDLSYRGTFTDNPGSEDLPWFWSQESIAGFHKHWSECETIGVPIERRPRIIQMEPTPGNLRALDERMQQEIKVQCGI